MSAAARIAVTQIYTTLSANGLGRKPSIALHKVISVVDSCLSFEMQRILLLNITESTVGKVGEEVGYGFVHFYLVRKWHHVSSALYGVQS